MVSVVQNSDTEFSGVLASDLYGVLDSLGTGVHEHHALRVLARSACDQEFGNANVAFVGRDGKARVSKTVHLVGDCRGDGPIGVANCGHSDARSKVNEVVAVDVDENRTFSGINVDGKRSTHTGWHNLLASLVHGL